MGGGGGGDTTQTTETNPWAPAAGHGENILGMAEDLFNQQGGIDGNWIDFVGPSANSNLTDAWQNMGSSEELGNIANQLGGLAGQMGSTLPGALDAYKKAQEGYTTYDIQNMRDTLLGDKQSMMDDQNAAIMANLEKSQAQAVGGIYGQAAGGGNVGSSRTQLASGQATGNLSAAAQSTMANLASQSFDSSQTAAMNTLQSQQNAQLQAAQAGFGAANSAANMYNQQGALQQQIYGNQMQAGMGQFNYDMMQAQMAYQNLMGQQNAGWQNLGMYNQFAGGWAGAGGTATTTTPNAGGGSLLGAVAGGVGGFFLGGPTGAITGAGIGSNLSDERLKTSINKLGVDKYGLNVYEWSWNEEAQKFPEEMRNYNVGYIAQEVQEIYPSVVHEHESGYLMIDYGSLEGMLNETNS